VTIAKRAGDKPKPALGRALERLARRDHTEQEIRHVLEAEGYSDGEIDAAVARLVELRAVDDTSVAARFARSRLAYQGLGRNRIQQALESRGVARPQAQAGLTEALAEISETAVLDAAAHRFWKERGRAEPLLRMRRLYAHLVRRGFPPALVQARLSELWPRWREALEGLDDNQGTEEAQ
jgi:regulatory protein